MACLCDCIGTATYQQRQRNIKTAAINTTSAQGLRRPPLRFDIAISFLRRFASRAPTLPVRSQHVLQPFLFGHQIQHEPPRLDLQHVPFRPPLVYLPVQPLPEKSLSHVQGKKLIPRVPLLGKWSEVRVELPLYFLGKGIGYRTVNQPLH